MIDTDDIMNIALNLAGMTSVPADTEIFRPVERIERILLGIDIGDKELLLAKSNGYQLVIAHHPLDETRFVKTMDRQETLMLSTINHKYGYV
jgi:putative NIF3 family GTP cyclohydrolase 1 type 2